MPLIPVVRGAQCAADPVELVDFVVPSEQRSPDIQFGHDTTQNKYVDLVRVPFGPQ